jgi:hypothetical protein
MMKTNLLCCCVVIGQVTIIGLLMCLCTMSGIKTDDRLHFCQILSQMMDGQSYDGHRAGRGGEQCYITMQVFNLQRIFLGRNLFFKLHNCVYYNPSKI